MERRRLLLLVLVVAGAYCVACASARYSYYAATHRMMSVSSGNMEPTLKSGDVAAVDASYYKGRPVERFDMVTYKLPAENRPEEMAGADGEALYLTRVVGLGGETLEIKDGRVFIDGVVREEPFTTLPLSPATKFGPVKIPQGEFFLMGDNRENSLDSRYWARPTLKKQFILGKVVEIFPH